MNLLGLETAVSGLLVCAAIVVFLIRFGKTAFWVPAALTALALDQVSKARIASLLAHPAWTGGNLVQLDLARNYIQGFDASVQGLLLPVLAGLAACSLLYQWLGEMEFSMSHWSQVALALVLGGLASIAIDRLRLGYTPDFIGFAGGSFSYNLADLAAIAGCGMLCCRALTLGLLALLSKTDPLRRPAAGLGD